MTGIKSVSNREKPFIIIENKLEKKGQMDKAVHKANGKLEEQILENPAVKEQASR